MTIRHKEDGAKGIFFIEHAGERAAEMTYSMAGDELMIIDHTQVDDSLRGQGAGRKLLDAAVNFARKSSLKILPLCPFAAATFKKSPEIQDVLRDK